MGCTLSLLLLPGLHEYIRSLSVIISVINCARKAPGPLSSDPCTSPYIGQLPNSPHKRQAITSRGDLLAYPIKQMTLIIATLEVGRI